MKIKNIITVLLVFIILASCAPAAKVVPTETTIPTSTFTPVPTATITPTLIPTINVEGQNVLDPHFSNPDFFDVGNANSPIVQFAKAFNIKPEDVIAGLEFKVKQDINGNNFVVLSTSDGIVLLTADKTNEQFVWQIATPGNYWNHFGKHVGLYMDGEAWRQHNAIAERYFSHGGILSLSGQVRPGPDIEERRPSSAAKYLQFAKQQEMILNFNNVVEPGKFPKDVTAENVDEWLNRRLSEIADVINQNKPEEIVYIQFNEAWFVTGWNTDSNPIKDRYGEKWLEEYTHRTISIFMSKNLIPNKDFVFEFNENEMYNPAKQQAVHSKLLEARINAYNRLMTDSELAKNFIKFGITKPEDIVILLGTQTHITVGKQTDSHHTFFRDPTKEQIDSLANLFSDLGGLLMTEVNPYGDVEQQGEFIKTIVATMATNPNLRGIILWNLFFVRPNDMFMQERLILFNDDGSPTKLYYELLRH
jgi:hypothetical protein